MNKKPIIMETLEKNIKEETLCVFCLSVINEGKFTVVEETIKGILDILLLTSNVEETNISTMCDDCSVKLFAAFDFKTKCVETEDCIFPYINPEKRLDLREVYLNETDREHLNILSKNDKICRLCMQIVTCGFIPIKDVDVDTFRRYIPEVNFSCTKEPVICRVCLDLLGTHTKFLKSCFEMKERIKGIDEDKNSKSLCNIKHEEIDIKPEENDDGETQKRNEFLRTLKTAIPELTKQTTKSKLENYSCGGCKYCPKVEKTSIEPKTKKCKKDRFLKGMYICGKCDFRTKEKETFTYHKTGVHGNNKVKAYKCDECNFETYRHNWLIRHKWRHHSLPNAYKCNVCDYVTDHKESLNDHVRTHVSENITVDTPKATVPEVTKRATKPKSENYSCGGCKYCPKVEKQPLEPESKKKKSSSVKLKYGCSKCDFRTKEKETLEYHKLKLHSKYELKTYECDECDFKTDYGHGWFMRHKRRCHSLPGEYKCGACSYTTNLQRYLNDHMVTHQPKM